MCIKKVSRLTFAILALSFFLHGFFGHFCYENGYGNDNAFVPQAGDTQFSQTQSLSAYSPYIYRDDLPSRESEMYSGQYNYSNNYPITNYVTSAQGNGVTENVVSFNSQATTDNGYLAMSNSPKYRRNNTQTLVPRYPSYDHWSSLSEQPWTLQLLPDGLIFPSYLAGMKEPRLASMWVNDKVFGNVWDASLGGRAGLMRFGTPNSVLPEGVQLDIEGAVLLRMDMEYDRNMMANDFRAGIPLTFGGKRWQFKFGYYHLSSHMGDEHIERTGISRLNYVRDSLVFAVARRFHENWRAYGEAAWAFFTGDETEPWEFQFGIEYAPISPAQGFRGTPFAAANLHVFQERNYSGYLCCQVGWQWRGKNNQMFRFGLQYLNGYDDQFEFHNQTTEKIGFGIWYDF